MKASITFFRLSAPLEGNSQDSVENNNSSKLEHIVADAEGTNGWQLGSRNKQSSHCVPWSNHDTSHLKQNQPVSTKSLIGNTNPLLEVTERILSYDTRRSTKKLNETSHYFAENMRQISISISDYTLCKWSRRFENKLTRWSSRVDVNLFCTLCDSKEINVVFLLE